MVDASTAGAWVLPDERSRQAEQALEAVTSGEQRLALPELWTYETANLLLTAQRRGRLDEAGRQASERFLASLPGETFDHREALARERIHRLALRFELSAYDAAYLELADRLQCELATLDGRLEGAADRLGLAYDWI